MATFGRTIRLGAIMLAGLAITLASASTAHAAGNDGGGYAQAATPGPRAMAPAAAPAGYPVNGIDVSNYQPGINWAPVAAGGATFSYAKATEGNGYLNPEFSQQYNGAKAAGLFSGAYDFGRPDQRGGTAEADFFLDHAGYAHDGRTLPPMLDIEWPYKAGCPSDCHYVAPYPCYGLSAAQMVSWIAAFVNEVQARTGQHTMIYTATSWWNQCTGSSASFAANPLFIVNYNGSAGALPPGWSRWTLWQYADSGPLPGDQDVFNGTAADLAGLAGTGGTAAGPPLAAFQANNGSLYTYDSSTGATYVPYGLKSGTSPAVTPLANGSYELAFQANTGFLYTYSTVSGATATTYGMLAGTSPAIAANGSGWLVAFQGNDGLLYTRASSGVTVQVPYGLKTGTSPAVAALANGSYEIVFQANTGFLYSYSTVSGATYIPYGMMAGTSPSIAANGSGWQAVFQADTGFLYTYSSSTGATAVPYGMMAGTSPSI